MIALSLGWGTQSFGLAAMSALGDLPKIDVAIFADTTHERTATYEFAAHWTPWIESHGIPVVTVKPKNADIIRQHVNSSSVVIPAYTNSVGKHGGQIRRQCTIDRKIRPVRRVLRSRYRFQQHELWLGISADEITRVKPSSVAYITHRWPLCESLMFTREQVKRYLIDHGLDVPPRSACVFCPFQSKHDWSEIRQTADGARAIQVDDMIRAAQPPGALYLLSRRLPLRDVSFDDGEGGWDSECAGYCHT